MEKILRKDLKPGLYWGRFKDCDDEDNAYELIVVIEFYDEDEYSDDFEHTMKVEGYSVNFIDYSGDRALHVYEYFVKAELFQPNGKIYKGADWSD